MIQLLVNILCDILIILIFYYFVSHGYVYFIHLVIKTRLNGYIGKFYYSLTSLFLWTTNNITNNIATQGIPLSQQFIPITLATSLRGLSLSTPGSSSLSLTTTSDPFTCD